MATEGKGRDKYCRFGNLRRLRRLEGLENLEGDYGKRALAQLEVDSSTLGA